MHILEQNDLNITDLYGHQIFIFSKIQCTTSSFGRSFYCNDTGIHEKNKNALTMSKLRRNSRENFANQLRKNISESLHRGSYEINTTQYRLRREKELRWIEETERKLKTYYLGISWRLQFLMNLWMIRFWNRQSKITTLLQRRELSSGYLAQFKFPYTHEQHTFN